MKHLLRLTPWLLLALFVAELVFAMLPRPEPTFHLRAFGRLPVLLNGRVQPFDSVGRNGLLQIRDTASVPLEEKKAYQFWKHPKKLKATEWLLEVMMKPETADTRPIFLIHHPELLSELKLEEKGVEKSGLRYYTFNEISAVTAVIQEQGRQAGQLEAQQRNAFQRQALKLANAVMLYDRLKNSLQPADAQDFAKELAEFERVLPAGMAAFNAREAGQSFDPTALQAMLLPLRRFQRMAEMAYPLIVPPLDPAAARDQWSNAGAALMETAHASQVHPALKWFATMATAFHQNRPDEFNRAVDEYTQWLRPKLGQEVGKGRAEFFHNQVLAFKRAMITYLFAFVLAGAGLLSLTVWPAFAESMRRSALFLVSFALLVHTAALVFRMVLEGRPPVTNLYSSAIFIGWGCVVLGVILERIYRVGIGVAVAAITGFITLIIAHNLALGGDTMEMMRAVLDSNFWLTVHVLTITIGYSTAFLAGFLGIVYILLGVLTPLLTRRLSPQGAAALSTATGVSMSPPLPTDAGQIELGKALTKMVYGILCFAMLFSFVGTVTGGIWADQSWGRFWGWDPKENGALIIVLWIAAILHARWGGVIRERGLMGMAIFGNVVTSYSWFGVNMLGIGLHSYGFMDAAFIWLMLFVVSQLFFIALGCVPTQYWRSFRPTLPPQAPSPTPPLGDQPTGASVGN